MIKMPYAFIVSQIPYLILILIIFFETLKIKKAISNIATMTKHQDKTVSVLK